MTVTMDRAGRIVIPKEIRDRAGLAAGSPLTIRENSGRVEIEPEHLETELVRTKSGLLVVKPLRETPPATVESVRQSIEQLRRERDERNRKGE